MARTVRNPKLDTRSARSRLAVRREPYWVSISRGCALGYRRGVKGGTWIARLRSPTGKQLYEALGSADDVRDPDGHSVFSFSQAQQRARSFFDKKSRALARDDDVDREGPYTVANALEDYLADREQRGSKSVKADRYAANARIVPHLGTIELEKLTSAKIKAWRHAIEIGPKLQRSKKDASQKREVVVDFADPEVVRSRRATSNRILTVLKAALNQAFSQGRASSDEAWRRVKAHREVDKPLARYLSADECRRLTNAADASFANLIRGALLTGARYGELCRMIVGDFNPKTNSVVVRISKAGKPRHIYLNEEGYAVFTSLTAGRAAGDFIFIRSDGKRWGPSHQQRPIYDASQRARISPPATFHSLRHTYASTLAMRGVSMQLIAKQLGHADTRITEKHYAHLSPSYVSELIKEKLPALGIYTPDNVLALTRAG